MKLGWIRRKVGLVSQEPLLFATTIKENITYGKEDATIEEIKTAIELANAAKFVDKLPNVLLNLITFSNSILSLLANIFWVYDLSLASAQ